jgi:hypothetical protein
LTFPTDGSYFPSTENTTADIFVSSGLWSRVVWKVFMNVSEDPATSVFKAGAARLYGLKFQNTEIYTITGVRKSSLPHCNCSFTSIVSIDFTYRFQSVEFKGLVY